MGRAGLNVRLRPVTTADLGAVAEIFGWYVQHTVTTFEETPPAVQEWDELRVLLDGIELPFLVAEADSGIAGYAYASPWRRKPAYRYTVEDSVFVAHDLAGRGQHRSSATWRAPVVVLGQRCAAGHRGHRRQ